MELTPEVLAEAESLGIDNLVKKIHEFSLSEEEDFDEIISNLREVIARINEKENRILRDWVWEFCEEFHLGDRYLVENYEMAEEAIEIATATDVKLSGLGALFHEKEEGIGFVANTHLKEVAVYFAWFEIPNVVITVIRQMYENRGLKTEFEELIERFQRVKEAIDEYNSQTASNITAAEIVDHISGAKPNQIIERIMVREGLEGDDRERG